MVEEDASVAPSLKNLPVAPADKIVTMAPTNKNENVVPTSNNDNLLASEYLQYQPEATNPVEGIFLFRSFPRTNIFPRTLILGPVT